MERIRTTYSSVLLAADGTVADIASFPIRQGGEVSIYCAIDNGAGIAPTDTPVGVWELWVSANGTDFYQITSAAIVAELALIAPNGNNLVSAWAVFANVPGYLAKIRYNATSGGATSARATLHIAS